MFLGEILSKPFPWGENSGPWFVLLEKKVADSQHVMSPVASQREEIRHTFTHHFHFFTVCCTTVSSKVLVLLLRVYFWNGVFNIFIQGALHVTEEWCSWTGAYVLTSQMALLPCNVSALQSGQEVGFWTPMSMASVHFSHWHDPLDHLEAG